MEVVKYNQLPVVVGANTKKEIENLADAIVTDLLEKGNPLELAEILSSTEHLVKKIKEDVRYSDYVKEELAKNSGKFTTQSGSKIEVCEVGTKYDFSKCNDPYLTDLYTQKELLDNKIKEREAFLKTVPVNGMELRYEDELITIFRPSKTSTSSYKTTLAK